MLERDEALLVLDETPVLPSEGGGPIMLPSAWRSATRALSSLLLRLEAVVEDSEDRSLLLRLEVVLDESDDRSLVLIEAPPGPPAGGGPIMPPADWRSERSALISAVLRLESAAVDTDDESLEPDAEVELVDAVCESVVLSDVAPAPSWSRMLARPAAKDVDCEASSAGAFVVDVVLLLPDAESPSEAWLLCVW